MAAKPKQINQAPKPSAKTPNTPTVLEAAPPSLAKSEGKEESEPVKSPTLPTSLAIAQALTHCQNPMKYRTTEDFGMVVIIDTGQKYYFTPDVVAITRDLLTQ